MVTEWEKRKGRKAERPHRVEADFDLSALNLGRVNSYTVNRNQNNLVMFGLNLDKLSEMNQVISPCGSRFRRFQKIKSDIDIRILFGIFVARLRVGILVTCLRKSKIKLRSCLRPQRHARSAVAIMAAPPKPDFSHLCFTEPELQLAIHFLFSVFVPFLGMIKACFQKTCKSSCCKSSLQQL